MTRQQIILIAVSVVAVVLIFQLPRVVMENEPATEIKPHDFSMSDEDQRRFSALKQQLKESSEIKKSVNFADSLANLSLKYQMADSATKYAAYMLSIDSTAESRYLAGMIYYRAFQMAGDAERVKALAGKARELFEELLRRNPDSSSIKNKLAMTLITTETPMAGIQLLREVLEAEPENREAIMNLGLLAIRSGQYDRAAERFEKLLELDSTDDESLFYLGVAYAESGNTNESKQVFESLINREDADPALKATASNYLRDF